jgi:hypothetical protein
VALDVAAMAAYWSVVAAVVARFGLLANACCATVAMLLALVPLTYDISAWYFRQGLIWAVVIVALAGHGYVTATRGRPLFAEGFFGDE